MCVRVCDKLLEINCSQRDTYCRHYTRNSHFLRLSTFNITCWVQIVYKGNVRRSKPISQYFEI